MRYLADTNVLLPVLAEGHALRQPALVWWERCDDAQVYLCLPVHMALLRLLTNVRVMGSSLLQPEEAWAAVNQLILDPRIAQVERLPSAHARFWCANVADRQPTPDLWTDAWLAALAQSLDCEMVSFDRGFLSFSDLNLQLLSPPK